LRDLKNSVQLLGNLGGDVTSGVTMGDKKWANFSIATTDKWVDKDGVQQEQTQWHNIGCFGKLAEVVEKYLEKGSRVMVEGKLKYRNYTDKNQIERKATSIEANDVVFLSPSKKEAKTSPEINSEQKEELPF
jgi:single-strand DNA-binding protein